MVDPPDGYDVPSPEPSQTSANDVSRGQVSVGGVFNVNLYRYVELPKNPGIYLVTISCGESISNPVKVEIVVSE
jgi:hypothetical protein